MVKRRGHMDKSQQLPTLQQLRRAYKTITYNRVAEEAGVPLTIEYLTEIGGLVREEHALKVLQAFSRLVGRQYTFENVAVNIRR